MILITGGMGFIGLHTAKAFLDAGEDVVVTKFRTSREPSFIKEHVGKRFFAESIDITNPFDMIEIVRKHKVTGIVHLAVPPVGAVGGQSMAEDYRINMMGLINVLEAGRIGGVKRVSLASSIAVYAGLSTSASTTYTGPTLVGPFKEDMPLPLTANNPTTAFKKAFEVLGNYYGERTGLDVVLLRIAGIYGPLYHSMSNLPSRLVHAAVRGEPGPLTRPGQAVPFTGGGGDLTYAKDCAKGIQSVQMSSTLKHRVYNIGSGRETSGADLAKAVQAAIPKAEIALQEGAGPNQVVNNYLDLSRTTADTGWTPQYSPDRGVADYVEWLRAGNAQ